MNRFKSYGLVGLGLALWLCGAVTHARAQTNLTVITTNGPASNRVNVVIMAEGYLASQFAQFRADATNVATMLLTNPPYAEYASYFNVYALAVASTQAGSDHPVNNQFANTYFNSTYGPSDYYLSIPDNATGQGKVDALMATYVPQADLVVLLVNDSVAGGSDAGGRTAVVSRGAAFGSLYSILAHETGHVFANLGDEYTNPNPGYPEVEEPNTTRETNRVALKWQAWIDAETEVPTPATSENLEHVGLFEGAHYHPTGWYRPKINCMMRSFGVGFCEVCSEALILAIYRQVRPIENIMPTNLVVTVTNLTPITFQLHTVAPTGHALAYEWRLNGILLAGATNASLTLGPATLASGPQTLAGRVFDPTPAVRNDPTNLLSQTVTWQLQVNVPQLVLINPAQSAGQMTFAVTGTAPQNIVIQTSTNLTTWSAVATGALSSGRWNFTNAQPSAAARQFFRAMTPP
jgi:hypothetical protein